MLAFDHRESFKKLAGLNYSGREADQQLISIKKEIIDALSDCFSGLLIDTDYGLPAYLSVVVKKPFLLPVEKSGYNGNSKNRLNSIECLPIELVKRGADGVKLLLYFNPVSETVDSQLVLAKKVLELSQAENLPLFLEIVTYDQKGSNSKDFDLVYSSLERFLNFGIRPDVFKLPFSGSKEGSEKITRLLGKTPWIVLTAGEKFEVFKEQLEMAIAGGASGFLAGRSVWQDIFRFQGKDRQRFLEIDMVNRFKEIIKIALNKPSEG